MKLDISVIGLAFIASWSTTTSGAARTTSARRSCSIALLKPEGPAPSTGTVTATLTRVAGEGGPTATSKHAYTNSYNSAELNIEASSSTRSFQPPRRGRASMRPRDGESQTFSDVMPNTDVSTTGDLRGAVGMGKMGVSHHKGAADALEKAGGASSSMAPELVDEMARAGGEAVAEVTPIIVEELAKGGDPRGAMRMGRMGVGQHKGTSVALDEAEGKLAGDVASAIIDELEKGDPRTAVGMGKLGADGHQGAAAMENAGVLRGDDSQEDGGTG